MKILTKNIYIFRETKPQTFADCVGNELPYGWEQSFDANVGVYYINHITGRYI